MKRRAGGGAATADNSRFIVVADSGFQRRAPAGARITEMLGSDADALLKEFHWVTAWAERVKAFGHGKHTPLDSKEALAIAKAATSTAVARVDEHDPNGRKPGERVSVMADDYGRDPVVGELVFSNAQEIAIKRTDPAVGDVVVHFPRAGFLVLAG